MNQLPFGKDQAALVPEFFGNNRLDFAPDPVFFWLDLPALVVAQRFRVVGAPRAFGCGISKQALDGRVRKLRAVTRTMAGFVEKPCDRADSFMLRK